MKLLLSLLKHYRCINEKYTITGHTKPTCHGKLGSQKHRNLYNRTVMLPVQYCHIKLRSLQRPRHVDMYSVIFLMTGSDSGGITDTQPDAINGSHQWQWKQTTDVCTKLAILHFPFPSTCIREELFDQWWGVYQGGTVWLVMGECSLVHALIVLLHVCTVYCGIFSETRWGTLSPLPRN